MKTPSKNIPKSYSKIFLKGQYHIIEKANNIVKKKFHIFSNPEKVNNDLKELSRAIKFKGDRSLYGQSYAGYLSYFLTVYEKELERFLK